MSGFSIIVFILAYLCLSLTLSLVWTDDQYFISLNDSEIDNVIVGTEGARVKLWCNATGNPTPMIYWYMIREGERFDIGIRGMLLQILDLSRDCTDSIKYLCEAFNGVSPNMSKTFLVQTEYRPTVYIDTDKDNATNIGECLSIPAKPSGTAFRVVCSVDASPNKNITWYRNGTWVGHWDGQKAKKNVDFDPNTNYKYGFNKKNNTDNGKLELIMNIQVGDTEDYQWIYNCVAINEHGTDEKCVRFVRLEIT